MTTQDKQDKQEKQEKQEKHKFTADEINELKKQAWADREKKPDLSHKEALDAIAKSHKYENWRELTKNAEGYKKHKVWDSIEDFIQRSSSKFFDSGNMRAFGCKIETDLLTNPNTDEQFLVTSEVDPCGVKRYTVRQIIGDQVESPLGFHNIGHLDHAIRKLRDLVNEEQDTVFRDYEEEILSSIVARVKEDALESDDPKMYLQDIVNNGCSSGIVGGLIYYKDTTAFFLKHQAEINSWLGEQLREYGKPPFRGWDNEDPLCLYESNRNTLAWAAYEEAAIICQDLFERDEN